MMGKTYVQVANVNDGKIGWTTLWTASKESYGEKNAMKRSAEEPRLVFRSITAEAREEETVAYNRYRGVVHYAHYFVAGEEVRYKSVSSFGGDGIKVDERDAAWMSYIHQWVGELIEKFHVNTYAITEYRYDIGYNGSEPDSDELMWRKRNNLNHVGSMVLSHKILGDKKVVYGAIGRQLTKVEYVSDLTGESFVEYWKANDQITEEEALETIRVMQERKEYQDRRIVKDGEVQDPSAMYGRVWLDKPISDAFNTDNLNRIAALLDKYGDQVGIVAKFGQVNGSDRTRLEVAGYLIRMASAVLNETMPEHEWVLNGSTSVSFQAQRDQE